MRKLKAMITSKRGRIALVSAAVCILLAGSAFVSVYMGCRGAVPPQDQPIPGRPSIGYAAPDFTADLLGLGGSEVTLSRLRDYVVVLVFMRTTCGACTSQLPALAQLYRESDGGAAGYIVAAVAVQEQADVMGRYLERLGVQVPVLMDSRGRVARDYGVTAIPTTFVIGRDGLIKDLRVGAMTYAQFVNALKNAL